MKKMIRRSLLAVVGLIPLVLSSCTVMAVGTAIGAAYYVQGEYVAHVAGDIHQTVAATNSAALDLNIQPSSRTGDADKAIFIGVGPDGKKVTIKLKPERPEITTVKIRVGVGDKESSRLILQAIEQRMQY